MRMIRVLMPPKMATKHVTPNAAPGDIFTVKVSTEEGVVEMTSLRIPEVLQGKAIKPMSAPNWTRFVSS